MIEALLNAVGGTVEAKTRYKTLSDIKAQTLVEVLHHTLATDKGRKPSRCSTRWLTC